MASPPGPYSAYSPPPPSSLALPRQQRPQLALPNISKSRAPSITSATPSSAHPLRQTSFPPPDSLEAQHALAQNSNRQYSPSVAGDSLDEFSDGDGDIQSAISGPASSMTGTIASQGPLKKKKRGEKRNRGRPPKNPIPGGTGDGDSRSSPAIGKQTPAAEDADVSEEEEEETTGRAPIFDGGQLTPAEILVQKERKRLFYLTAPHSHQDRYASFSRAKLRVGDVRKLVNSVLGQSVPQNVVLVVGAYTKMFAGLLAEDAREVQAEWMGVESEEVKRKAAGSKLKRKREGEKSDTQETMQSSAPASTDPTSVDGEEVEQAPGGAAGLGSLIADCDRGPLLPDHLREALRRYKKRRAGGTVGFTGLSTEGREGVKARMGGKRLFR